MIFSFLIVSHKSVLDFKNRYTYLVDKSTGQHFRATKQNNNSLSLFMKLIFSILKGVSLEFTWWWKKKLFLSLFLREPPPRAAFVSLKKMVATSWRRYRKIHRHTIDKGLPKLAPWDLWGSKRSCFELIKITFHKWMQDIWKFDCIPNAYFCTISITRYKLLWQC